VAPLLDSRTGPEDGSLEPRSIYAAIKLAQEYLATAWARQTGDTVWALRYHNVYGPRMPATPRTPGGRLAIPFRVGADSRHG
jgi:dTDP-L-rhamnose 4-epimerase